MPFIEVVPISILTDKDVYERSLDDYVIFQMFCLYLLINDFLGINKR